ncbi:DUF4811 domain-containing protein [Pediococcus parvulus]|uniref:DUF4811 domain-containing protein n=1 Tax=Pediococcus parvulus TaxID=54062 RepID=UPI0037569D57
MIIIFLFAGAILFACSMIFMHRGINKMIWVTLGLILSIGSVVLIALNYNIYLGMKEVNQTQTYPLTSSVKSKHAILYQQIGTKDERIYYYATNPLQQKLAKTDPTTGTTKIKRNSKLNQVKITRKTRVYKNEEMRLLFSNGVPNKQFVSQDYEFHLMSGWTLEKVSHQKQ